jgi:hypothetical protein
MTTSPGAHHDQLDFDHRHNADERTFCHWGQETPNADSRACVHAAIDVLMCARQPAIWALRCRDLLCQFRLTH